MNDWQVRNVRKKKLPLEQYSTTPSSRRPGGWRQQRHGVPIEW
jgi:hypothetical protein